MRRSCVSRRCVSRGRIVNLRSGGMSLRGIMHLRRVVNLRGCRVRRRTRGLDSC